MTPFNDSVKQFSIASTKERAQIVAEARKSMSIPQFSYFVEVIQDIYKSELIK